MRVRDWRDCGLDVLVHLVVGPSGLDPRTLGAVLEARRLMLTEAAGLAADRRSEDQAELLVELADRVASAGTVEEAQLLDFAFFAELVQAARNVVFVLITNSIRDLYLQNAARVRPSARGPRRSRSPLPQGGPCGAGARPGPSGRGRAPPRGGAGAQPPQDAVVTLSALTPREASIFACVCDTVVAPEPELPAVSHTSAVAFLDGWLAASPRLNRFGASRPAVRRRAGAARPRPARSPAAARCRAGGHGRSRSPRQPAPATRVSWYGSSRTSPVSPTTATMGVMRRLGYDADANVRRARELRRREGRP